MAPVKKLLNVVGSCEIRGRLRCNAGSIGYRNRIRKALVHSRVTLVSWNRCQGINLRIRPSRTAVPSGLAAVAAASRHRRRAGQGRAIRFASADSRLSVERSPLSFRGAPRRLSDARDVRSRNHAGYRFRLLATHPSRVTRLGHRVPISGRPEIGGPGMTPERSRHCHFNTRSTCRISLKGTAECSMPLPADWPSPLTV